MEVEVLKHDKNEIEIKSDNGTLIEILRVYLNKDGVEFAAWKREHPSQPAVLRVESSGKTAKKAISDAILAVKKDLDNLEKGLKK